MAQEKLMLWLLIIPLVPYFLLLIYIYSGLFRNNSRKHEIPSGLKISVVIACRDEEKNLPSLLNDLVSQDYPADLFEVIVVDDHSTDSTGSLVSSFHNNGTFRCIRNTGTGKKSALRTGIMSAKGDLILTTDGDCRLNCGWISSMASFWMENQPDLVIGPVNLIERSGFLPRFEELEFFSLQGVTAGTAGIGDPVMCNGANLAFPAEIYRKHADDLHGEIASGDDVFLLHSIKTECGKILWNGNIEAVVKTDASGSLRNFLRQRARWISKSGSYSDRFTKILALITLIANTEIILLTGGTFFVPEIYRVLIAAFILKSIPDLLILSRITARYKKTNLLWWFIPSQVIYPFYVVTVSVCSLNRKNRW
jgi:poly-beta-1,6-N-acetyl-D-glucosamine synthase